MAIKYTYIALAKIFTFQAAKKQKTTEAVAERETKKPNLREVLRQTLKDRMKKKKDCKVKDYICLIN